MKTTAQSNHNDDVGVCALCSARLYVCVCVCVYEKIVSLVVLFLLLLQLHNNAHDLNSAIQKFWQISYIAMKM